MVAFQPTFKLMLVSLHLVVLLGLQYTSALANGLHANHDGNAGVDNAIRRHAARAGRLSKRFPRVSGTNVPAFDRRERHHRFGLTPAQIEELLKDEDVEDSDIYVPASNTTNATSTSSHTRHRTRRISDSQDPTGTRFHSFALPTSNSTLPSNTTSSEASSATPTSHTQSPLHNSTSSSQSSDNAADTPSRSAASTALPTSSADQDDSSDGSGGLLGGLLHPSSTSATRAAQQTSASHGQDGNTGSSDDDDDDQDSTPHSSSRSSSPAATSASASPASTASSQSNNGDDNSDDNSDDSNDDLPASSSHASKTSQPDFYSFAPQPTSSSTQAAPTSTSGGLLHGILPGLGQSSSASSAASPTPTASSSSSKGSSNTADPTDGPSDENPTNTSKGVSPTGTDNGTAPTGSADGSDGTTSQTSIATSTGDSTGPSSTVTAGPSSTASQGPGSTPTNTSTNTNTNTNTNAGNGSDSGSSVSSNTAAPAPTSTTSDDSDSDSGSGSGSSSGSAAASTTTTNPYWYANTQSLNLAPSSTSSAESATQTSSHSSDSDSDSDNSSSSSTNTNNEPDSSTAWLPGPNNNAPSAPAPQDLPTTIVPSADSYNQPENTTSIGLLFKQDMKWTWVISQADLTAQIFAFMPDLVGHAVSLDSSKVSTVKLASYSPETGDAATTNTLTSARTLYMAYVPSENVDEIQAMISNTSSPFYTSAAAGAPQQLASQVDPTFNILSVAGKVATGAKQKATSGSGGAKDGESTLRNSLIGVGCGLAGCFAIAVGGLLWRKQRKDKLEAVSGGVGGNGVSRAHTIRSFSGGLRETWAPDTLDQHRALGTAGQMQEVWSPHDAGMGLAMGHPVQPMQSHSDGFGGYVASDPFQDVNGTGGYVNMNRSSRMTERSNYSDLSQMTEAQRIQFDYESRRSFHSTSDHSNSHGSHSEHSAESSGMLSTYQDDYRIPRQHTNNHAFGVPPRSNTRRRGSVASSTIGRPEMMSNSVLL